MSAVALFVLVIVGWAIGWGCGYLYGRAVEQEGRDRGGAS